MNKKHLKSKADETHSGSLSTGLISTGEESVDGEQDSVDDCQGALGNSNRFAVAGNEANQFSGRTIIPELQDQDTADDEQGAPNGREEQIWKGSRRFSL